MDESDGPAPFPSTSWAMIYRAGSGDGADARKAMGKLLERYMAPLRSHLVYERGFTRNRADDLLHDFITEKVLEGDFLKKADQEQGNFRSFVLTSLNNYVRDVLRKEAADKRKPDRARTVEGLEIRMAGRGKTRPGAIFDLRWAREVLKNTINAMRKHCRSAGRKDIWGVFHARIIEPALNGAKPLPYDRLVEEYDIDTPSRAYNVLVTGKRMFRRFLRSEIQLYETDERAIEQEIKELKKVLENVRGGRRAHFVDIEGE